MTEHRWDRATEPPFCQRCGVQKGSHAEECGAPENMISLQPYLRKRAWEKDGKILVETFPKDPA